MTGRRAFRWAPLAGTAGIGVMAGHWLSYDVAIPGANAATIFTHSVPVDDKVFLAITAKPQ